jgi:predicted O-methyltransferase YrrM
MLYLLLESILIYGIIDNNTTILIYTSTEFMNIIKKSHLFNDKIVFEINDTYNNIDKACKSRLDFFELESSLKYNKILYLDTDIIIKDDINTIFNLIQNDILYTLEEGDINNYDMNIDRIQDYYGRRLFGDEIKNYKDTTAFNSGILLFNNCDKIRILFQKIKEDIQNRSTICPYYDQPYIVYNAFKYNLYNNKILKAYAMNVIAHVIPDKKSTITLNNQPVNINYNYNIYSDKIIHHFSTGVGVYIHKIEGMTKYLNDLKDYTIENNINNTKKYINHHLLPIIYNIGELLEGNIFMFHHTTTYTDIFLNKSKNICNLLLNKQIKNVMEIGFNSGFSTLLMLISNPNVYITCIDIGDHKYTLPCYEKLKETFGERINLIIGDSTKVLQNINTTYDLIHIDGGHTTEVATSDIIQSFRLSKTGTILIMDDYDFNNLHDLWDEYCERYNSHLKKLNIHIYNSPHHDIKYIVK